MTERIQKHGEHSQALKAFSELSSNDWYQPTDEDESKRLRQAAKLAFLANDDVRYPEIGYPRLDSLDMDLVESHYQRLLADALDTDDDMQADIVYEPAARKLAELYRHKEVQRRLGWSKDVELSRQRAGEATFELFGDIDQGAFAFLIHELRTEASKVADSLAEARELLELTDSMTTDKTPKNYEITRYAIEVLRRDLYEIFPGLEEILAHAPADDAPLSDKRTFVMEIIGIVSSNPEASLRIVEHSSVAASTSVAKSEISIGADRLAGCSRMQLIKTATHEAIGHLERGNRARLQNNPALRETQPDNLAFEEGFATAIEQIITGETRVAGKQYYMAIGLQLGLDRGGERRDFRDTFEVMWRRIFVEAHISGNPISHEMAQSQAYSQVMRTNRGGAIDARDLSYFEGSKRYSWVNTIAEREPRDRLKALNIALSGRFDAANRTQWDRYEAAFNEKEAMYA